SSMPDSLEKRGPQDAARVSLNEPWEVRYWCDAFDCTEDELKDAISLRGNSADALKTYFGKIDG
ncbi:MAG TPA: DUF3606 domain-containing protein, partial [Cytophagales bacterium]|nr:DUF3606 domain-containing protein [Cytophagales bacterium]